MSKICFLGALFCGTLLAQPTPEPLRSWQYYKEVRPPAFAAGGLLSFMLDAAVLDKARPDGGDLRLYTASGTEIPYVLRIRRAVENSKPLDAREFNRGSDAAGSQVSLDLGSDAQEHNEVDLRTAGSNFRRKVDVEGSSDQMHWSVLASRQLIFRFSANGPEVEQQAVRYPVSRYRYLRIHVSADPDVDRAAPQIEAITVLRSVREKAELLSFSGQTNGPTPDRRNGRPASIWHVDLGGRIQIESLVLTTVDTAFSRPFELYDDDDSSAPVSLASGDLTHRQDAPDSRTVIAIPEHRVRRLKLIVTDDRNPALNVVSMVAFGAARQIEFQSPNAGASVLHLYYGNPKALAPHYDLTARLDRTQPSVRIGLSPQKDNPIYRPDPKALSERQPWLVYLVLLAACLVLAAILLGLLKKSH